MQIQRYFLRSCQDNLTFSCIKQESMVSFLLEAGGGTVVLWYLAMSQQVDTLYILSWCKFHESAPFAGVDSPGAAQVGRLP